jgi:hypothetical protein
MRKLTRVAVFVGRLNLPLQVNRRQWVIAAAIPDFPFQPAVHVNYQETTLHIKDGLPKLKDFPAEMGGSGDTLPE